MVLNTPKSSLDKQNENQLLKPNMDSNLFEKLKNDLLRNTTTYTVVSGDTMGKISNISGIKTEDLISLNNVLGKDLSKKSVLHINDVLFLPKSKDEFYKKIEEIKQISSIVDLNKKTREGLDEFIETNTLFPKAEQSIGLQDKLKGVLGAQKYFLDPILPRVVDMSREEKVSCANFIRTYMYFSVNPRDLKPEERVFFRKQNIDAWMLPTELSKVHFNQKFADLMNSFDKTKIGEVEVINPNEQANYDKRVLELSKYLETSGIPGSLVPYYFKLSKYKKNVAEYNLGRTDKHLNTHQSLFAGNGSISINAYEVPDLSTGVETSFMGEKQRLNKEIDDINFETPKKQSDLTKTKESLILKLSDKNIFSSLDRSIDKQVKDLADYRFGTKFENVRTILNTGDKEKIRTGLNRLLKRNFSEEDINYYAVFAIKKRKAIEAVNFIKQELTRGSKSINLSGKSLFIEQNKTISNLITKYNNLNKEIDLNNKKLTENKIKLQDKNIDSKNKRISVIDYLTNFIQLRLDYGSAYDLSTRKKIIEGIGKYSDMIHLKIDGKAVDLKSEILLYKQGKSSIVKPESKIEITGPMMLDGEHQMNKGEERKTKMNGRTRFFFEFIVPQTYLATELIEPNKDSSFLKNNFGTTADKLKIKGTYMLKRGDTIEKVLRSVIPVYEGIDVKNDKDAEKKINYHYSQQIKALQIAGILKDENHINPGAVKVNKPIDYYDTKDISIVYNDYVKTRKTVIEATREKLKSMKTFATVNVYPGDNENMIFSRLLLDIKGKNISSYKNIQNLSLLPYADQKEFIKSLFKTAKNPDGKFLVGRSYNFSFSKMEQILDGGSLDKTYINIPKNLRDIDNFVIENAMSTKYYKSLAKNIVTRESYGKNMKQNLPFYTASSLGDFQLRIGTLAYGFEKNGWLNKENLEKAFNALDRKEIKDKISSMSPEQKIIISEDLKIVEKMKEIISKGNLEKTDFRELHSNLRDLLRIDDGTSSNIVGKVISASLLEYKLNNHSEKLYGMLGASGEDLSKLNTPEKQKQLQKVTMLVNNKTENMTLKMLFDNYIIRLIRSGMLIDIKTTNKISGYDNLETLHRVMNQPYKPSVVSTLIRKVVTYDNKTFEQDLYSYYSQVEDKGIKNQNDKEIFALLEVLVNKLQYGKLDNQRIYDFMKNPKVVAYTQSRGISNSLLPEESEYYSTTFGKTAFNYVKNA